MSKPLVVCWLVAVAGFTFASQAMAKSLDSTQRIMTVKTNLPEPVIDAKAWALLEVNSGWVVAGNNVQEPLPPASITKLMMNYVLFEQLAKGDVNFTDQVPISEEAWRAEGSRMFADVNTRIELLPLLKSTIVQSGNDAAIALAEFIGGSEIAFAQLMNRSASDLGLHQSNFINSTGLPDEGHVMSSSDIAALSAAIIREFPDFYEWYAEKEFTHNGISQANRNRLLWKDDSVDGLKTGFTSNAGYCLVASALRNGQRWVAVVMGSDSERSREKAVLTLLNYGFSAYQPVAMLDQQGGIASAPVYGGEVDEVRLQAAEIAHVVVPAGRAAEVVTELQYSPYFEAPIAVGQAMGVASLSLDGKPLVDMPLVSMSAIKPAGWWKRMIDSVKLYVNQMLAD